jgi:hypothetical protein
LPPTPSFFYKNNNNLIIINLITKKIRAGNKPLTASSRKSGTGEKKKTKNKTPSGNRRFFARCFMKPKEMEGFKISKCPLQQAFHDFLFFFFLGAHAQTIPIIGKKEEWSLILCRFQALRAGRSSNKCPS